MKLRVLGCSGGELRRHRTTCFLVDGKLAIDAGALTASLPLDELVEIDDIVLTHSHLDHVKDVPLLADLLVGRRTTPLTVHASRACARALRENLFNGEIWPDFTRLPDPRRPVLSIKAFDPRRRFRVGRYTVRPVPVAHTVESVGLVLSDGVDAVAVSGDTGPTTAFWKAVNAAENLRALLVETSFPNRLQAVADASGHLTPRTLAGELAKLERDGYPVYLYHLKPAYASELRRELGAMRLDRVRILSNGEELRLGGDAIGGGR
ncbi:MAG TPA: 3',5'-cyclic-nucleotide phosphodiesterase, partial [Thermoanaerobaculia bacterium]|nr:3',5'-cyclic-nucleotide phosphodiesterase [Thermoanaerobaculia bacterium]